MHYLPGIFSLLVLAAGWHYLFMSNAAMRLGGIEDRSLNAFRIRLRRANGVVMMLLAISLYGAYYTITEARSATLILFVIAILLPAMMILALIDLQLTRKLRKKQREKEQ